MLEQRIQQQFFDSADLQYQTAESLARPVADAAQALTGCITAGGKLLVAGVGGGAALAQHFCAAFVGRFERERPALAAVALAADAVLLGALARNGEPAWVKQIQALGQSGDVLLLIDPLGKDAALKAGIEAAHARDMAVVLLGGRGAPALRDLLGETDVLIAVPHDRAARVVELQLLVLHCLCDAVDLQLMGEQDPL
ncbi:MAG TPA: SIS domain-containing protein [Rubrivivax sp.]|nr:SIS domain-containing protein [Rubrivivax sp.]